MKTMNFWLLALLALLVGMNVAAEDAEGATEPTPGPEMEESKEEYDPEDVVPDDIQADTNVGSITTFHLWNAQSNKEVRVIKNGDEFCPKLDQFSIEAKTSGSVGSVYIMLDGPGNFDTGRIENVKPWFLAGNNAYSNIFPVTKGGKTYSLKNGSYLLYAEPFKQKDKKGNKGTKKTIRFKINCPIICRRC